MKIYALVYEDYVDSWAGDKYYDTYLGFYATRELAEKANIEKHNEECNIVEIEVKESEV